ncbi:stress protein [Duganella sp. Leaf61]|uniref:Hsp20/alpha crystallin family protein n=1 Tax=Duganella sp. Leaf61 TaxID=1736227 RepID=UPI0006F88340|nr:Hsp20/alpha crystallin family protein [Duganella sp. Leaf61]KQN70285.1 stress protein [Duganella sp. Leaf61]
MANSLMHIDPFRDLTRFDPLRDIDDLFRNLAGPTWRAEQAPRMRMDVSETEQQYLVKAELPGVQKEDIKVSIHGNQVSLSAEVKNERNADAGSSGGNLRSERYYGLVQRSFTLPQEVDDDQAEARYENGVLSLTLPKKMGTGGKQLAIQ